MPTSREITRYTQRHACTRSQAQQRMLAELRASRTLYRRLGTLVLRTRAWINRYVFNQRSKRDECRALQKG